MTSEVHHFLASCFCFHLHILQFSARKEVCGIYTLESCLLCSGNWVLLFVLCEDFV
uniref:Uncharacterized protein n=1 Tax=Rhizophora mucronata TaxID=61149 RepID=A0A2P2Q4F8_RHIMU